MLLLIKALGKLKEAITPILENVKNGCNISGKIALHFLSLIEKFKVSTQETIISTKLNYELK